jgi:cell division protein DivIC
MYGRMKDNMNKRKGFPLIRIIIFIAFIYFGWTFIGQQRILDEKNMQNSTLKNKIKEQQNTNSELKKKKSIMNTDEYIEKVAREKLGMVKDGEKKYIDINR